MTAYSIEKPSRTCAGTGRELKAGEAIHSVLVEEQDRFRRRDYAAADWPGPSVETVAHWATRLPADGAKGKPPIDDEMLFECFEHLAERNEPAQRNLRYVLALFLLRRKRLLFVDTKVEDGRETMVLKDRRGGKKHSVADPGMDDGAMQAAQEDVQRILEGD